MILGFIGTGKISSSIIYGIFKSKLKVKKIYISSRNRNIAKKLAKKFGSIRVLKDNQEIVDKSSVIFLGITIGMQHLIAAFQARILKERVSRFRNLFIKSFTFLF